MTDEQLIALIENHLVEDLDTDQLLLLRQRVKANPALARAVLDELLFEQQLATFMAPKPPDFQTLMDRLIAEDPNFGKTTSPWIARSIIAIILLIVVGSIGLMLYRPKPATPEPLDRPPVTETDPAVVPATRLAASQPVTTQPTTLPTTVPTVKTVRTIPVIPPGHYLAADSFQTNPGQFRPQFDALLKPIGKHEIKEEKHQIRLSGKFQLKQVPDAEHIFRFNVNDLRRTATIDLYDPKNQGYQLRLDKQGRITAVKINRQPGTDQVDGKQYYAYVPRRWAQNHRGPIDLAWHQGRLLVTRGRIPLLTLPLSDPPVDGYIQIQGSARLWQILEGQIPTPWTGLNITRQPATQPAIDAQWAALPASALQIRGRQLTLTAPPGKRVSAACPIPLIPGTTVTLTIDQANSITGFWSGRDVDHRDRTCYLTPFNKQWTWTERFGNKRQAEQRFEPGQRLTLPAQVRIRYLDRFLVFTYSTDGKYFLPLGLYEFNSDIQPRQFGLLLEPADTEQQVVAEFRIDQPDHGKMATDEPWNKSTITNHLMNAPLSSDLTQWLAQLPDAVVISRRGNLDWADYAEMFDLLAMRCIYEHQIELLPSVWQAWIGQADQVAYDYEADRDAPTTPPLMARLYLEHLQNNGRLLEAREVAQHIETCNRNADGQLEDEDPTCKLRDYLQTVIAGIDRQLNDRKPPLRRLPPQTDMPNVLLNVSREAVNALAEFELAIQAKDYRHAATVIARQNMPNLLTPTLSDPDLYQSAPDRIRHAIRLSPQLQQLLQQRYADQAALRLQRAMAGHDMPALKAVADQFYGTPAAETAARLLVDRDLALGNFLSVIAGLEQLSGGDAARLQPTDRAKLRLAMAMTGDLSGPPITTPVQWQNRVMSPENFEQMVNEIARHRQGEIGSDRSDNPLFPPPAKLQLTPWLSLKDHHTSDPAQIACHDPWIVVHLCGQLIVADRNSDRVLWKWQPNISRMNRQYSPSKPVIVANRLLVRMHQGNDQPLICLPLKKTGPDTPLWSQSFDDLILTDPINAAGRLYLLTQRHLPGRTRIVLRRLSPDNGESILDKPIIDLQQTPATATISRPMVRGDRFYVAIGNLVLCTDLLGRVRWARHTHQPTIDPDRHLRPAQRMAIGNDRLFVAAPDGSVIQAIDRMHGKIKWTIRRQSGTGIVALDTAGNPILANQQVTESVDMTTGQTRWWQWHRSPALATAAAEEQSICTAQLNNQQLTLIWLDRQTGKIMDRQSFQLSTDKIHQISQLTGDNGLGLIIGAYDKSSRRSEILILKPAATDDTPR